MKILWGLNRFYGIPTSPSASIMAQNIQFGPCEGNPVFLSVLSLYTGLKSSKGRSSVYPSHLYLTLYISETAIMKISQCIVKADICDKMQ